MDHGGISGLDESAQVPDLLDLRVWGKSRGLDRPYPLVWHLVDTGAMVEVLWRDVVAASVRQAIAVGLECSEADAGRLVAFWAALHDIGKIIPGFQVQDGKAFAGLTGYTRSGERDSYGHDLATQQFLARLLGELGYARGLVDDASCARVAQVLGGHHGCFHEIDSRDEDPRLNPTEQGGPEWESQRRAVLAEVEKEFAPPVAPRAIPVPVAAVICALVILADWLVSQEDFILARQTEHQAGSGSGKERRWVASAALRSHRAASTAAAHGLVREVGLGRLVLRSGSFTEEFPDYTPNTLQKSVAEGLPKLLTGPGLLLVMAPMGFGKTETALHAARLMGEAAGAQGLFVTLPTMATADQMYSRVEAYLQRRGDPAVGSAAVTLLHSMAWLNRAYNPAPDQGQVVTGEHESGSPPAARTVPSEWLRGAKKGLVAPAGLGTVDQALLAVLPARHNVLRMLGLAGKVLVVDEVHAYDAYMQYLLARLLTWLGTLRAPVVLLSATLPEEVAKRLVRAYLLGTTSKPYRKDIPVTYPGWVYADADSATVTPTPFEMDPRTLAVDLVDVPLVEDDPAGEADEERPVAGGVDRRAALRTLLAPILREGGSAMVVCTTVAEAQQTFAAVRTWCNREADPGNAPVLTLLHARMPAREREARIEQVTAEFGRDVQRRPHAAILVATQVVEQSLDLDVDLVISDLAPIAQLLQRAGRCQRHPQVDAAKKRPAWAVDRPRLAVLLPRHDGEFVLPERWTWIYNRALLRRTYDLLAPRHPQPVSIPADVQPMVNEVYDETFRVDPPEDEIARIMEDEAARGIAAVAAIPAPRDLLDLQPLTKREIDEDEISTRLGAPSVRVVCCYVDADGNRWLDPTCRTNPLPAKGAGRKDRFTQDQVRAVLSESIPMRDGQWRREDPALTRPPASWSKNPNLCRLVLLPHAIGPDGKPQPVAVGNRTFRLDPILGLLG